MSTLTSRYATGAHHRASGPVARIRNLLGASLTAIMLIASASPIAAQDVLTMAIGAEAQEDLMVTVYNNGYGLVREVRAIELPDGIIELEFRDVAQMIDATSVAFKSLTSPGDVGILEQNYRYDLLSPATLLEKFVGREVTIIDYRMDDNTSIDRERTGTLLSTNNGNIVQFGDEIVINPGGTISLAEVPDDLLAKPTLVWLLRNDDAGKQRVETSYLTNGMSWKADYVVILGKDDDMLDITGWVTLNNNSGTAYRNAQLKLVAGDVQRVQEEKRYRGQVEAYAMRADSSDEMGFQEKAFFEYHLYTLGRRTTLANNETKQVTLLEGGDIPAKKVYIMESQMWAQAGSAKGAEKRKMAVMIEFENKEEDNLGMPLPKGRLRFYKADDDGSLLLIGEDQIDHTPRDEKVRLKLGEAFDIVAERAQMDYRKLSGNRAEMDYQVTVRNHKDEAITATILEHIWGDWEIQRQSHRERKVDSQTVEFNVAVPARGETVLIYTVRVNW